MSDRKVRVQMRSSRDPDDGLTLYCDGESGTFRLFVDDPIDLSLKDLTQLRDELSRVIDECERDPWANPEYRKVHAA